MYQVGGGGDSSCRQAEEDVAEHCPLKVDPRNIHNRIKCRSIGWRNTEDVVGLYCVEFAVLL